MQTSRLIVIGIAAGAMLVFGCSKRSDSIAFPVVAFKGYHGKPDLNLSAVFEFKNPSQSKIFCQLQVQPDDLVRREILSIDAGSTVTLNMPVKQTNAVSLIVTVVRLVPVHQISVPMQ
jgi:hypothetical protein